jgi:hypothetical protein
MAIEVDSESSVEHLAGVVLSVFVDLAAEHLLSVQDVMVACERDPSLPSDELESRMKKTTEWTSPARLVALSRLRVSA